MPCAFSRGLVQVGSSYELESVVVGRQFHAPLPTDLSGIALSVEREPHNAVDPMVRWTCQVWKSCMTFTRRNRHPMSMPSCRHPDVRRTTCLPLAFCRLCW